MAPRCLLLLLPSAAEPPSEEPAANQSTQSCSFRYHGFNTSLLFFKRTTGPKDAHVKDAAAAHAAAAPPSLLAVLLESLLSVLVIDLPLLLIRQGFVRCGWHTAEDDAALAWASGRQAMQIAGVPTVVDFCKALGRSSLFTLCASYFILG